MLPSYLKFWGKARGARAGEASAHPLAYHALDVAAAADVLLRHNQRKLQRVSHLLGTRTENARRLLAGLAALHDVGKFSRDFQAGNEAAWQAMGLSGVFGAWQPRRYGFRHDLLASQMRGLLDLRKLFDPAFGDWTKPDITALWNAVAGHHGQPRPGEEKLRLDGLTAPACQEAVRAFCRDVRALFDPLEPLPPPGDDAVPVLSWLIAGLTVLADWTGSNRWISMA